MLWRTVLLAAVAAGLSGAVTARAEDKEGEANAVSVAVQNTDGVRNIQIREGDRRIEIREDTARGIRMVVGTTRDGKEESKVFEAKNAEELRQKHPEAYRLYRRYTAGDRAGVAVRRGEARVAAAADARRGDRDPERRPPDDVRRQLAELKRQLAEIEKRLAARPEPQARDRQPPREKTERPQRSEAARGFAAGGYGLPAYSMLHQEHVQKELSLTPQQKEKLKDIARKQAERMKTDQPDWAKTRDMSPEARKKLYDEVRERYAKRAEEANREVERVLEPRQLERLKMMEFRQRAAGLLYMPQVPDQLGLSDKQKQQIKEIRETAQRMMTELQNKSQEKVLHVLTPEQTEKLKDLSRKGWPAWTSPGGSPPREKAKD